MGFYLRAPEVRLTSVSGILTGIFHRTRTLLPAMVFRAGPVSLGRLSYKGYLTSDSGSGFLTPAGKTYRTNSSSIRSRRWVIVTPPIHDDPPNSC